MQSRRVVGILGAGALVVLALHPWPGPARAATDERVPVRIGWQIPAATQGQIVQVLKRTDVLEVHGIEPRLIPYSYGTPQVEAALMGTLDVVFAGDQPAINLVMRGGRWKIVSRLFYDRIAIMVPPASTVRAVRDLDGRTVASPFGSVAHRVATQRQQQAGLDPRAEVANVDLDILEIRRLVQAGGLDRWGDVDAVAVWEPTTSYFQLQDLAVPIETARTLGVVAFSEDFIAHHRDAAVQVLVALVRAWHFFAENAGRVRQWYIHDTQLGYTPAALRAAAQIDPNFRAESVDDVDLFLTEEQISGFAREARWAEAWGLARGEFRANETADQTLLAEAMQIVAADAFEPVEVLLPSPRELPSEADAAVRIFDRIPLWLLFLGMVLLASAGIELGQRLGRWRRRMREHEVEGPVGTVVGAVLALLAFVIALTFASAGGRFDARKQALLDEVNAIGTAYLRADLLPEPHRTTSRTLLRDYVEVRLGMYRTYGEPDALRAIRGRTAALQESLWAHAQALAQADGRSEIYGLFAEGLNEVFDLHTTRVVLGAEYRIPFFVWVALGLVSLLSMVAVGFQFGLRGRRSLTASLALGLTFALVILLIVDFDRPGEGLIEVNQQPMTDLYESLARQE